MHSLRKLALFLHSKNIGYRVCIWVRNGQQKLYWMSENWVEWNLIAGKIPYGITEIMYVYFTVDNDGSGIQALAFIGRLGYRSKKNDVNNNQSSNEEYPADLFTSKQMNTNWLSFVFFFFNFCITLKCYRFDCSWATFERCNCLAYFCSHISFYIASSRLQWLLFTVG